MKADPCASPRTADFYLGNVFWRGGRERRVLAMLMAPQEWADLRKFGYGALDMVTERAPQVGLMAHLWGAQVTVRRGFPEGRLLVEYDTGLETWCEAHGWAPGDGCPDPVHAVEEVHEG